MSSLNLKTIVTGVALAAASAGLFAQNATPRANARDAVQEKRIEIGESSGTLTSTDAARLERQRNRGDKVEDKARPDGDVTAAERATDRQTN